MPNAILDAFYSLGRNLNKTKGSTIPETEQGVVSEKFPELTLEMENEDLISLTKKWKKSWDESKVFADWKTKSEENENYWLGKHFQRPEVDKTRAIVDNIIFESLETYLPQALRKNPDPMVNLDDEEEQSEQNLNYAKSLQKKLGQLADKLILRLKLKKITRHWAIYLLGVVKFGWDMNRDIPTQKVIRVAKLILDPNCTIDEDGYSGEFIGEHRKLTASVLLNMLSNIQGEKEAEKTIKDAVKNQSGGEDLGTEIGFIEWWTDQYMCWTLADKVLMKKKNPHWNYESQKPVMADPMTGEAPIDQTTGQPQTETVPGTNHFEVPQKPYLFLSVFNLGKQPIDDTSLIGQNLSNQDVINKRVKQIDKNADSMNGGMVVSGERSGLTQQQSKGVTGALRKGGTVWIPTGTPDDAVKRSTAPALPSDIFGQLVDMRNRTRDIFGSRGLSSAGLTTEDTVRGKIINKDLDTSRIGGGLSEFLEQLADGMYNWIVQLLYVYDDKYAVMQVKPKVNISVKEGSLLPKDSTTVANQSMELAGAGKMSLIDLYKNLDYPNPEELAANVWLEANAPEILFGNDKRVQQVVQMKQDAARPEITPPSESINYKDLPPEGQSQLAAKAGIQLHPEAIAAHQSLKQETERSIPLPDTSEKSSK